MFFKTQHQQYKNLYKTQTVTFSATFLCTKLQVRKFILIVGITENFTLPINNIFLLLIT